MIIADLYLQSGSYKGFDRWANTNQRSLFALDYARLKPRSI